ncbi:MAG: helix-turn-helix domain-containing protein [bacterium]|nr:helix-turn-helix domain-containing protein [bacterium]
MSKADISKIHRIFGENVRNIRVEKGLTIKEVSLKTGITEKYLFKIENGNAKGMKISHIFKLAQALNMMPYQLCEGI